MRFSLKFDNWLPSILPVPRGKSSYKFSISIVYSNTDDKDLLAFSTSLLSFYIDPLSAEISTLYFFLQELHLNYLQDLKFNMKTSSINQWIQLLLKSYLPTLTIFFSSHNHIKMVSYAKLSENKCGIIFTVLTKRYRIINVTRVV